MELLKSLSDGIVTKPRFELRFLPRPGEGRSLAFPCDAAGHVEMDALDEHLRVDYFFARALRGRNFSCAVVAGLGQQEC
jgi:hypothetical protein